jgi:hypothetical protein
MAKRKALEQRIFFPWERRGSWLRRLGLHRVRPFFVASVVVGVVLLIGLRERERSGIRQTRATIMGVRHAVDTYLADHEGECPKDFDVLSDYGAFSGTPRDAWGRPLRFVCPGRGEDERYELFSDGPDGEPGGLDRIE